MPLNTRSFVYAQQLFSLHNYSLHFPKLEVVIKYHHHEINSIITTYHDEVQFSGHNATLNSIITTCHDEV